MLIECASAATHLESPQVKAIEEHFQKKYPFLTGLASKSPPGTPFLHALIPHNISVSQHQRYFDKVKELEQYAINWLPSVRKKDKPKPTAERTIQDAKNPLIISLELLSNTGDSLGEIELGVFISGDSSSTLDLAPGKSADANGIAAELKKLDDVPSIFAQATNPAIRELQKQAASHTKAQQSLKAVQQEVTQMIEKHAVTSAGGTVESYKLAPKFEFSDGHTPLLPASVVDLSEIDKFKQLCDIFFGEEFKDSTYLMMHLGKASPQEASVKQLLDQDCFGEEGAFHEKFNECFRDSEQAFLAFLEQSSPQNVSQTSLNTEGKTITSVTIRLLSPRDICKFCRGTLSMSLGNGWLQRRLLDFLKKSQGLKVDSNLSVSIYGYSTSKIPTER